MLRNNLILFIDNIFIQKYYKWLTLLSFVVFLVFTTNHQFAYLNMGYDYILQSISSISFINGHGFSIPIVNPDNVASVNYEANGLWPVGYSLLSVPFLLLTDNDAILTYRILFILSTSFLFFVSYRLLLTLKNELDYRYFFIAILFWAISYFPFKNIGVTDIFSLSFFILALIVLVKVIDLHRVNKVKSAHLILLGIISFLPAFFRFAYYPICIVISGTLFFLYFKKKQLLKYSIITGVTTAACILGQMIFMRLYFASGKSIEDALSVKTQLFYFSNLQAYDAIFLNAFIDDSIISRLTEFLISPENQNVLFFCLSAIIFLIVVGGLYFLVKNKIKKQFDSLSPIYLILLLGSIASIITIFFLSFISIWYPSFELTGETSIRTWVMFSRYHTLPMYFFQFFLFVFLFSKKNIAIKHLKFICALLLLFSATINGYYWLIHEYKFQTYQSTGGFADANSVYTYIKNKKIKNDECIYVSTKRDTENEFIENDFSGFLSLKSINPINYYLLPNGIEQNINTNCILATSGSNSIVNENIQQLSKFQNVDTILFSSALNKYILYIDKNAR